MWLLVGYVLNHHHHVEKTAHLEVFNDALHSTVGSIFYILGIFRLTEILTSHDGDAAHLKVVLQWHHFRFLPSLLVSMAGILLFCAEIEIETKFVQRELDPTVIILAVTSMAVGLQMCKYPSPEIY